MIDLFHWLASFVVLSVALARLEAINITAAEVRQWITRAVGWSLLGIDSFVGIIEPLFGRIDGIDKVGLIGVALCALSYRWDGATKYEGVRRRANDH
jgi:hypothetical protein